MWPSFLNHADRNGWIIYSLEQLIKNRFITGHLDGNHGNLYPRQEEFVDSGVKYISANSLVNGKVDFSKAKFLTAERASQFKKGVARSGDVIFAHNATVGPVALLLTSDNYVILSTSLTYYRCNQDKLSNQYLLQYMASSSFSRQYEKIMKQTTRNQIPITTQRDFFFIVPPLPEQQKIAQILSTWDKAIEKLEVLIAAKQKRKKALMQQILSGKRRFAEFGGEWAEVSMGNVFKRVTRKNTEGDTNVVTISAQKGLIKQEDFFNKTVASETLDHYFLLKKGEFAYNKSYSNGYPMGAIKRLNSFDKAVVTTLYICFAIEDYNQSCSNFFEHYFESGRLVPGLMKVANEGGRAHGLLNVTPRDFFNLKIRIPELKEQQKIASVLTATDTEIETHKKQLTALKEQKKGLMQQLLTGKKRVQVGEIS